jgi:hypothetical protein
MSGAEGSIPNPAARMGQITKGPKDGPKTERFLNGCHGSERQKDDSPGEYWWRRRFARDRSIHDRCCIKGCEVLWVSQLSA